MSGHSLEVSGARTQRVSARRSSVDSMDDERDTTDSETTYSPRHSIDTMQDQQSLPQSVSHSLLFMLPREIRDRIYSYCLTAPEGSHLEWPSSHNTRTTFSISPSLLRTSKLIAHEATPILYSSNILSFSHPSDANMFVRALTPTIAANRIARLHLPIKVPEMRMWMPYLTSNDLSRSLRTDYPALRELTIRYKSMKWHQNTAVESNLRSWSDDARLDELINGLSNVYYPHDQQSGHAADESEELPDAPSSNHEHSSKPAKQSNRHKAKPAPMPPSIRIIVACRAHSTQFTTLTSSSRALPPLLTVEQTPAQAPGVAGILDRLLPNASLDPVPVKEGDEFRGFTYADFRGKAGRLIKGGRRVRGGEGMDGVVSARSVFARRGRVGIALEVYAADVGSGAQ